MKKLGIIVDSLSFYSKAECDAEDFAFLPQSISIDGKLYADGVDIMMKDAVDRINNAKQITSASPSAADIEATFVKMAAKFEHTVYFAMSKAISSTYQIAKQIAAKFNNITVLDTKLVGKGIVNAAHFIRNKVGSGKLNLQKAVEVVTKAAQNSWCWIIPRTNKSFIQSGRLSGVKRLLLEKAKVVPRLLLTDTKIEVKALTRNFAKSVRTALDDTINKNSPLIKAGTKFSYQGVYCGTQESHDVVSAVFKETGIDAFIGYSSIVTAAHAGIGAIGIISWEHLEE